MKGIKTLTVLLLLTAGSSFAENTDLSNLVLCKSEFFVTTPQTVSFYAGKVDKAHFIGTTKVGKFLYDNTHCISDKKFIAITWDETGKQHHYKTIDTFNNVNTSILVQYPKGFADAPTSSPAVSCQVQILNQTPYTVDYYAGKVKIQNFLTELKPHGQGWQVTPCFVDKKIIGEQYVPDNASENGKVKPVRFVSTSTYTNLNSYPISTFPADYTEKKEWFGKRIFSSTPTEQGVKDKVNEKRNPAPADDPATS